MIYVTIFKSSIKRRTNTQWFSPTC